MTWQLMWLNLNVATLNTMLQFLKIYRFEVQSLPLIYRALLKRYAQYSLLTKKNDNFFLIVYI